MTQSAPAQLDAHPASKRSAQVVIDAVNKTFIVEGKPLLVLKDIDLTIRPGEFLLIVGKSGCGKSTLLRLLAGLETDYDGSITIGDEPVLGPSLDRGIVFQDHRLFPWLTVEANIGMAFEARPVPDAEKRARVREFIELVGLRGFEKAYPAQLSGGMAQRAAIARAMVNDPNIILMDEPLGALDFFTRMRLQSELQNIWMTKHVMMVLVTHDIDEALFLSDRIVMLKANPGRINRIVEVDLPRPRDRESPALAALRHEILREFES